MVLIDRLAAQLDIYNINKKKTAKMIHSFRKNSKNLIIKQQTEETFFCCDMVIYLKVSG